MPNATKSTSLIDYLRLSLIDNCLDTVVLSYLGPGGIWPARGPTEDGESPLGGPSSERTFHSGLSGADLALQIEMTAHLLDYRGLASRLSLPHHP